MQLIERILNLVLGQYRTVAWRNDPDFGKIKLNGYGVWSTELLFAPTGSVVHVSLHGAGRAGPTDGQRTTFRALVERFESLRQDIQLPLATAYEQARKDWQPTMKPIEGPSDIWRVIHLGWIELGDGQSSSDLELDHQIQWDGEDHYLRVQLKDWRVVAVEAD